MKLAIFRQGEKSRFGVIQDDEILDLSGALPGVGNDLVNLYQNYDDAHSAVAAAIADSSDRYALDSVHLEAPLKRPGKFMALGLNYAKHVEEARRNPHLKNIKVEHQVWFSKMPSCINGPYDPIVKPKVTRAMDYEVELAVVVGKRCRNVSVADAPNYIAGYMVANDVSLRDLQKLTPTMTLSKSADTAGPIGPWLTTADDIEDPQNLGLRSFVNGELRQNSNTSDMIFSVYDMVEHMSSVMTLEPGDLFITGTPEGVGAGFKPAKLLQAGDVVRVELDQLGHLEAEIIDEE